MNQVFSIFRFRINDPPILVLDEPTDGLDPNQKHEMRNLIREMGKTKAIIVSTHILEEVEAICTRVIIIDKGKVVFNGTPAELRGRSKEAGTVVVATAKVEFKEFEAAAKQLHNVLQVLDKGKEGGRNLFAVVPRKASEGSLAGDIKALMDQKGWGFVELHTEAGRLDDVFRSITSNETGEKKEETHSGASSDAPRPTGKITGEKKKESRLDASSNDIRTDNKETGEKKEEA